MFNPGKISVKESSAKDSAIVNMDLEEYDEEIPPIELERIQTTDHFDKEDSSSRVFISYLSSDKCKTTEICVSWVGRLATFNP